MRRCSYPLTGKGVVDLIVTDLAVIAVTGGGLELREVAPGVTPEQVQSVTEPRLRVAAEFLPDDLHAVAALANDGALDLDGLVTHERAADHAAAAYADAFGDPGCLKMVLDWRHCA